MGAAQRRKLSSRDPPNAARQAIRAAKTNSDREEDQLTEGTVTRRELCPNGLIARLMY